MNEVMTLEMLLELPKELLKKSEAYNEYSSLLEKSQYLNYNIKELKEKIGRYFSYFKDVKYFYQFPTETVVSVITAVNLEKEVSNTSFVDPIFNLVNNDITEKRKIENWIIQFYNIMLIVAVKLTSQEAVYLVDCFFSNKSEEITCEKLGICRNTLQKVKKSCIVKTWIELRTLKLPENI